MGEEKLVTVHVKRVTPEIKRQFKAACANDETNMSDVLKQAMSAYILVSNTKIRERLLEEMQCQTPKQPE